MRKTYGARGVVQIVGPRLCAAAAHLSVAGGGGRSSMRSPWRAPAQPKCKGRAADSTARGTSATFSFNPPLVQIVVKRDTGGRRTGRNRGAHNHLLAQKACLLTKLNQLPLVDFIDGITKLIYVLLVMAGQQNDLTLIPKR